MKLSDYLDSLSKKYLNISLQEAREENPDLLIKESDLSLEEKILFEEFGGMVGGFFDNFEPENIKILKDFKYESRLEIYEYLYEISNLRVFGNELLKSQKLDFLPFQIDKLKKEDVDVSVLRKIWELMKKEDYFLDLKNDYLEFVRRKQEYIKKSDDFLKIVQMVLILKNLKLEFWLGYVLRSLLLDEIILRNFLIELFEANEANLNLSKKFKSFLFSYKKALDDLFSLEIKNFLICFLVRIKDKLIIFDLEGQVFAELPVNLSKDFFNLNNLFNKYKNLKFFLTLSDKNFNRKISFFVDDCKTLISRNRKEKFYYKVVFNYLFEFLKRNNVFVYENFEISNDYLVFLSLDFLRRIENDKLLELVNDLIFVNTFQVLEIYKVIAPFLNIKLDDFFKNFYHKFIIVFNKRKINIAKVLRLREARNHVLALKVLNFLEFLKVFYLISRSN